MLEKTATQLGIVSTLQAQVYKYGFIVCRQYSEPETAGQQLTIMPLNMTYYIYIDGRQSWRIYAHVCVDIRQSQGKSFLDTSTIRKLW